MPITKIELKVWTSTRSGSGTNGRVYLGVAGREYRVNRIGEFNDFEPSGKPTNYVFGKESNVERPEHNDPRIPWQTVVEDYGRLARYIRFDPNGSNDNWNVERVELTVRFERLESEEGPGSIHEVRLGGGAHVWLGEQSGTWLWL